MSLRYGLLTKQRRSFRLSDLSVRLRRVKVSEWDACANISDDAILSHKRRGDEVSYAGQLVIEDLTSGLTKQFGPATMERRVIQEFIEIYRSEPSLWKVRSSHYNNKAIKNVAYRRMVNKLREIYPNADVEMVKRKINALRTNYRKELRKVEASKERNQLTGEPVYVPSLWYFELFHFIADQESEPPIIDVTDGVEVHDMLRVDFDENMAAFEREEMSDEFDDEFQVSSPESQSMRQMTNFSQNNHSPFKRRRDLSYKSEDQWYPKNEFSTSPTPDAEEVFGRYVASKLRHMDKSSQMLSERLISEVLFRGQMGLLTRSTFLTGEDPPPAVKVEE
ncbi:MADF domain-containing protein [Trichonephila inaurata madagascariensis]|uniref:MADF domain-containing protein n=1 Tax=Trichonephila inaurata madagascariensis TaxID=2747483 RepID=A0A8X6YAG5_9ARAC|nr:MADF domain-containing protein [Trichonephila inaurata madagascariensis]